MMLQGRDRPRLALETRGELRVAIRKQHFDCHIAVERFLVGLVDRGHPAMADRLDQFVLPELDVVEFGHRVSLCGSVARAFSKSAGAVSYQFRPMGSVGALRDRHSYGGTLRERSNA